MRLAFAIVVSLALVAACGGGAVATGAPGPSVHDAWVRVPAGPGQPAAAYLTIDNPGDTPDVLVSVTAPSALTCQLHQTAMDSAGMVGMSEVHDLDIPAGGSVRLEPGGYHLMLTGTVGLQVGGKVELRLTFARAGTITVQAEVRNG